MGPIILIAIGAMFIAGCASRREREEDDRPVYKYKDVKPILDEKCVPCHGGENPAANYDLSVYVKKNPSGYSGLVGAGRERIVSIQSDATHFGILDEGSLAALTRWTERDRLAYFKVHEIHRPGFLDPRSLEFHGQDLAANGWDLGSCRACHGDDYGGGAVSLGFGDEVQSCVACHQGSPETCNGGCHGGSDNAAPPKSVRGSENSAGAHQTHLNASSALTAQTISCGAANSCHPDHPEFESPGHADGTIDVSFSGLARAGSFDGNAKSCTVYCHGTESVSWNGPPQTCASCHPAHRRHAEIPADNCVRCHGAVAGSDNTSIADSSKHIDGTVEIGREGAPAHLVTCNSCHFDYDGPFEDGPFAAGAHRLHFETSVTVRPACGECHNASSQLFASGHMDSLPPAEVVFVAASRANWPGAGAPPTYTAGVCEARCHSPGSRREATSPWNGPYAERGCPTCHEIPPDIHADVGGLCFACHDNLNDDGTIANVERHITGSL